LSVDRSFINVLFSPLLNFSLFSSRKDATMPHIHIFLQQLDELYHAGDFDQYEQYWIQACQHAEHFFPGFTIAYAELSNTGIDREPSGSMRHVLVPQPQGVE
jgi:hypothetical protein